VEVNSISIVCPLAITLFPRDISPDDRIVSFVPDNFSLTLVCLYDNLLYVIFAIYNEFSSTWHSLTTCHGDLGRISDKWPIVFQLFDGFALKRQNSTFCPPRKYARIGVGKVSLTATVPAKTGKPQYPRAYSLLVEWEWGSFPVAI
jgi:hypothetical protein